MQVKVRIKEETDGRITAFTEEGQLTLTVLWNPDRITRKEVVDILSEVIDYILRIRGEEPPRW